MILEGRKPYLSEVEKVQNPALGAMLIWKYCRSYQSGMTSDSSPLLVAFLVLPLCWHRPTLNILKSTRVQSGLGKFCEKLSEKREELIAVHERVLELREPTLASIGFGERHELISIDYGKGYMRALDLKEPKLPERVRDQAKAAEKLGVWFAALKPVEIFHALRVEA
ncbi:three component ABC system middle component [Leisingera sp. D0M16]|uniref:three component ABC system middle component n=1 Tax=Leisingera coralii TaxID=3351347 RepID=UPI003B798164